MYRNNSADEIFRVENSAAPGSVYAKIGQPPIPGVVYEGIPSPINDNQWQQYTDSSTGKPYWHNALTNKTTWDAPAGGMSGSPGSFVDSKGEFTPVTPADAPVVMTWSAISVYTISRLQISQGFKFSQEKALLNNISGTITGGLWGIMGPSGGGKTTLLSVLSLRLDTQRMRVVGDVCINGAKYDKNTLKAMSGYVMQDDLVMPTLTVYETLMYTSALRMPRYCTYADREARVEEVMKLMGIEYTRDVIVGDSRNKGISGGERKRLCVAMELLPKPKLLFLDEPTSGNTHFSPTYDCQRPLTHLSLSSHSPPLLSHCQCPLTPPPLPSPPLPYHCQRPLTHPHSLTGLDSTTALSLMNALKDLCQKGECTVVCTIHQPQTKIYNLIDNLILMRKGEIVYQGPCSKAELYMAQAGYPCPDRTNPADHLLDVVILGSNMTEGKTEPVRNLMVPIDLDFGLDKSDFSSRAVPYWFWQFFVLLHRNLADKLRRWDIVATNIAVSLIVATFIACGGWYNISLNPDPVGVTTARDQWNNEVNIGTRNTKVNEINSGITKTNAIMFFTVIHQGVVSTLQGTHAFPLERALMLRERASGAYYCSAYFLSKVAVDSFFQLLAPIVFTAVTYPVMGLNTVTWDKAGIYLGIQILLNNSAVSLSNLCSCVCVSIELSTVVLALFLEITRLFSGFFISPAAIDGYPIWIFWNQVSYMHFSYIALVLNQYTGMSYYCTPVQLQNILFVRNSAADPYGMVGVPTMPADTKNNEKDRALFKLNPKQESPFIQKPYCKFSTGDWCAIDPATDKAEFCAYENGGWNLPKADQIWPTGVPKVSTYKVPSGESIILGQNYGYMRYTTQYCGGCLVVYIMTCRMISYLALRFIKM